MLNQQILTVLSICFSSEVTVIPSSLTITMQFVSNNTEKVLIPTDVPKYDIWVIDIGICPFTKMGLICKIQNLDWVQTGCIEMLQKMEQVWVLLPLAEKSQCCPALAVYIYFFPTPYLFASIL